MVVGSREEELVKEKVSGVGKERLVAVGGKANDDTATLAIFCGTAPIIILK